MLFCTMIQSSCLRKLIHNACMDQAKLPKKELKMITAFPNIVKYDLLPSKEY